MLSYSSSKAVRLGMVFSSLCLLIGLRARYALAADSAAWEGSNLISGPILKKAPVLPEESMDKEKDISQVQFGLGITIIPVQQLWNLSSQNIFFQGGGSLNFFLRAHPQVTIDLAIGGTGSAVGRSLGNTYGEFFVTLGPRIYIKPPPQDTASFHQMYYVVLAPQFNVEMKGTSSPEGSSLTTTLALGLLAGVGIEFRVNSHIVFSVDMRVMFRGAVNPTSSDSLEMGVRLGGGFGYFF